MSFLGQLLGADPEPHQRSHEPDFSGPILLSSLFGGMFQGEESDSGPMVTVDTALGLSAVYAAVRILSESVGALPLPVYQRRRTGGRVKAKMEPAYRLLHDRPNPEMTPMDCWGLVMTHLNLWGNAFIGKEFAPSGIVRALWPIRPDLVLVRRVEGEKVFDVAGAGGISRYTAKEIIHVRALSVDGLIGLSPVQVARQTIGNGLALGKHAGALMRDRAVPQGVVSMEQPLKDDEARKRFRAEWDAILKSRGRVAILDNGAKFNPITMPLGDAQFIEQQQFGVQEIARIFRLPPGVIGGSSGDPLTYKTVEGNNLHFLQFSLMPWLSRLEQALAGDPDLFPDSDLYPEYLVDAILRGDTLARSRSYALATSAAPWMTGGEIREMENLPPDPRFDVVAPPGSASVGGGSSSPSD